MEGNFNVQKNDIPGETIRCDQTYEQVKHEDKTPSGLKGIKGTGTAIIRITLLHLCFHNYWSRR